MSTWWIKRWLKQGSGTGRVFRPRCAGSIPQGASPASGGGNTCHPAQRRPYGSGRASSCFVSGPDTVHHEVDQRSFNDRHYAHQGVKRPETSIVLFSVVCTFVTKPLAISRDISVIMGNQSQIFVPKARDLPLQFPSAESELSLTFAILKWSVPLSYPQPILRVLALLASAMLLILAVVLYSH